MNNFVVMSTMRSGTTWLVSLLDSHEQVTCAGEMLHADARQCDHITYHRELSLGYYLRDRPGKRERAKHDQREVVFEYLDWFYASAGDNTAPGFKLMLNHIRRFPEVIEYLVERNVRVILLLRRNLVDRLISHALFSTRERPETAKMKERIIDFVRRYKFARKNGNGQLILNVSDCLRKLNSYEEENAALLRQSATCETEMIYYHDLIDNKEDCLAHVFPFLGVDTMEVTSPRKKDRTVKISELVSNYGEFRRRLEGTRFEKFLE